MPDELKFLCDENVDRQIVTSLRAQGFDVKSISEDCAGIGDSEVLDMAASSGRVLLTEDKDFGELIFRASCSAHGVLLIRLSDLSSAEAATLVVEVVEAHGPSFIAHFAVLTSKALRVRALDT